MHYAIFSGAIHFVNKRPDIHKALRFSQLVEGVSICTTSHRGINNEVGIIIQGQGNEPHLASEDANKKAKKLHNFLKVALDYQVELKINSRIHSESLDKFFNYNVSTKDLLDGISEEAISKYVNSPTDGKEDLLIEGIDEFHNADFVNAFAKLAYYLENTPTGKKFKPIRDSLSHESVDSAQEDVEKDFPGEFEFEGKRFMRSSNKNKKSLLKYWPEILEAGREKFYSMLKNS